MNLLDMDKTIKEQTKLRQKMLKNSKNKHKDKKNVAKLRQIYGDNFFSYAGSISEKKLRYFCNKIELLPDTTADIKQLKLDKETINSVCSEYNNIAMMGDRIVNIG